MTVVAWILQFVSQAYIMNQFNAFDLGFFAGLSTKTLSKVIAMKIPYILTIELVEQFSYGLFFRVGFVQHDRLCGSTALVVVIVD